MGLQKYQGLWLTAIRGIKVDKNKLYSILSNNADKDFVRRIILPDHYPKLKNKDGTYSTHSMTWGQFGDKYRVFPTVSFDGDKLKRFKPRDAWKKAEETGDFIEFDTAEEADQFSKEYKKYWD